MSIARGRTIGKPSVKTLSKRFSGRVADYSPRGSRAAASKARSITILFWPWGWRGGGLIAGNLQPSFAHAVNQVLDHFGLRERDDIGRNERKSDGNSLRGRSSAG
jgi:hypothetical protein